MQRIKISLPDPLAAMLQREARRRELPVSAFVREAVVLALGNHEHSALRIPFAGIGQSGHGHTARQAEEILKKEWLRAPAESAADDDQSSTDSGEHQAP